jgi:hypothetical protein
MGNFFWWGNVICLLGVKRSVGRRLAFVWPPFVARFAPLTPRRTLTHNYHNNGIVGQGM